MQVWRILKIFVKFILWVSAILFVAYLSVLLLFPRYVNVQGFKENIERQFHAQTGLYIDIERLSVEPAVRRHLSLDAYHTVIFYPDKKEMFKAKNINFKIKILPIIFRKIEIDKVVINRPVVNCSIDNSGKLSFEKYLKLKYSSKSDRGFTISETLPEIVVNRYKVKIFDKRYIEPFIAEGEKLHLRKHFGNGYRIITAGFLTQGKNEHLNFSTELESSITKLPENMFNPDFFRYLKKYGIKAKVISKLKIEEGVKAPKITGKADITDLSLIINGIVLKDNFIKLKFLDDKISVNADVKTNSTDRIKFEGIVKTGKDVLVDIACFAQDINLSNVKTTAEALLNAMNIKNMLDKYAVDGRANLNFRVKGSKKRISSSGEAELKGASIKVRNMPFSISNINSKINFSDDNIKIEPTKLYVNGTPIELVGNINSSAKVDITAKGKNLSTLSLIKFLPKNIKIPDVRGFVDFSVNLKGTINNISSYIMAELRDCTIFENGKILTKFSKGAVKISGEMQAPKGEVILSNVTILPNDFSNCLKSKELFFEINQKEIKMPKNKMLLNGTEFEADVRIIDYQEKAPSYSVDLNGKLNSDAVYKFLKKQKGTEKLIAVAKGNLGISGNISGKGNKHLINVGILSDKDNYVSFLVVKELLGIPSLTKINLEIDGQNLNIHNISLNKNYEHRDKVIEITGKIDNILTPCFNNLKIFIPKTMTFALAGLRQSEITVKSDISLNGKITNPSVQGNLEVKSIDIPEYKMNSKNNKIFFTTDNIKINLPNLRIGNSVFNIETELPAKIKQPFVLNELKLKSSNLDFNEISEIFENIQTKSIYPGVELPIKAKMGVAEIKKLKIGGLQVENITSDISVDNNVLQMKNIKGNAYGGSVSGKSEYDFLKTISLSEISGKNAQMSKLFMALTGKDDGTVGIVDYKLKLSCVGTKYLQQIRTSKGYMEYTATNGVMGKLGQFEHFLHAQNLISDSIFKTTLYKLSKAIKPQNTGVFTVSKGKMEILNGLANIKTLTVEGPKMSFYVTGKINLVNDISDVKIYGRISQEVENALGSFSSRTSQTILTTSSETSIGNIFYDDYNTKLPKTMLDAIPPLNPDMGLMSRPFVVVIKGSPENINSVKSFKWIVESTTAPTPVLREVEVTAGKPKAEKATDIEVQKPHDVSKQQSIQIQRQQRKAEPSKMPSFMDNLPDNIN